MNACLRRSALLSAVVVMAGCTMATTATEPGDVIDAHAKPSASEQERRDLMVGKWLGEAPMDGGRSRVALAERNNNGTYRITFRMYDGASYEESVEVGLWGIAGPTYFTLMRGWMVDGEFRPSDASQAYYSDAYRIDQLDATTFAYRSVKTGTRYVNRRVGDDFEFSD